MSSTRITFFSLSSQRYLAQGAIPKRKPGTSLGAPHNAPHGAPLGASHGAPLGAPRNLSKDSPSAWKSSEAFRRDNVSNQRPTSPPDMLSNGTISPQYRNASPLDNLSNRPTSPHDNLSDRTTSPPDNRPSSPSVSFAVSRQNSEQVSDGELAGVALQASEKTVTTAMKTKTMQTTETTATTTTTTKASLANGKAETNGKLSEAEAQSMLQRIASTKGGCKRKSIIEFLEAANHFGRFVSIFVSLYL